MIDADILKGDYVIVRQKPVSENNDVVVAMVNTDATVKRLSIEGKYIELRPKNQKLKSIIIGQQDELKIYWEGLTCMLGCPRRSLPRRTPKKDNSMRTYNLRRFAQLDVLKNIQQDNLITFLKRYEEYLIGREFSFDLNEDGELDFETLCQVLMNPSYDMNVDFVEALFFIQEMSDNEHFEELSEQAEANNIAVHENSTAADLALTLWLHDPELLKRPHAEVMTLKPKSFMYFQSDQKSPDTFALPKPETMRTLEADMDAWFLKNKRGTGCRILPISAGEEDKTYFLIRHGMPFKREGKIESGQFKTVFYRPEFHDVIVYDRANNELAVFNKSGAKKERTMYLDLFSRHLFGQAEYFPSPKKYTLHPLIDNGVDALACTDIDGLEDIKLVEIQHQFQGPYNDKQTLHSNDMFASLASRDREFPTFGRLISASFSVKFENAKRPRMVKVQTPNVANFDRKEDSHLIEKWLRKRGFVNEQKQGLQST